MGAYTPGDEIAMVIDGATTIYFPIDEDERVAALRAGEFVVYRKVLGTDSGPWRAFGSASVESG